MIYTDDEFYKNQYLLGRKPVIDSGFNFYARQSSQIIDQYTFGRLSNVQQVPEEVQLCCCELAELLYQAETVAQASLQQGGAGPLASYSNDGESGTFDLSQSSYTEAGKEAKAKEIIYRYLGNSGLLFVGV